MVLGDTIFAVASPKGSGERAVLRLSGPLSTRAASAVFVPSLPAVRAQVEGELLVGAFRVPALALHMPSPRRYTGEDVVELHVPGSPMLCAAIEAAMVAAVGNGLRPARPGEFTARACQNGRLDLAQAEGVLMLIHGADAAAVAAGASWLRGGLSAAVAAIRSRVQDTLALLELGLDFEEGDTGAVPDAAWRTPLALALEEVLALQQRLPMALAGGEVLLLGRSNAGKSSLGNALAGHDTLLVDAQPGTTRDVVRLELSAHTAVWDAPGDLDEPTAIDRAALQLRDHLGGLAAAALLVVDPDDLPPPPISSLPILALVLTKSDRWGEPLSESLLAAVRHRLRQPPHVPGFATSAHTGQGLGELRAFLLRHARTGARDAGAPVRHALVRAATALLRAASATAPELCSQDLQEALRAFDDIDGSHGVEDLLDRIYGRFCLGK